MAEKTDPSESAEWVREKLAALRATLEVGGAWPESADQLLDDVWAAGGEPEPLSDEDMAMVSLVIGDALQGVDVAKAYPRFFEKLLTNVGLREAFLEGLISLEETETLARPEREAAAEVSPLGFLRTATVRPVLEVDAGGGWRAQWQQLKETLDWLLSPGQQRMGMAWRSGEAVIDEGYRALLRSEALVGEQTLHVALDGRQPIETPDVLEVVLMVAAEGEGETGPLRARLAWGMYEDTAVLDEWGEATFAPVPLVAVWEEGVRGDLRLVVEGVMRDA